MIPLKLTAYPWKRSQTENASFVLHLQTFIFCWVLSCGSHLKIETERKKLVSARRKTDCFTVGDEREVTDDFVISLLAGCLCCLRHLLSLSLSLEFPPYVSTLECPSSSRSYHVFTKSQILHNCLSLNIKYQLVLNNGLSSNSQTDIYCMLDIFM